MQLFLNYSQNIFTCIPQNTRETAIIPFQTELKLYTHTRKYTRHRTSKKHKPCAKKHKAYIFKIQGTYFKISALYFRRFKHLINNNLQKPAQTLYFPDY